MLQVHLGPLASPLISTPRPDEHSLQAPDFYELKPRFSLDQLEGVSRAGWRPSGKNAVTDLKPLPAGLLIQQPPVEAVLHSLNG